MRTKDASVRIDKLCEPIKDRLVALDLLYKKHFGVELVITSGNDSTEHRQGSKHYTNEAIDTRTMNLKVGLRSMKEFLFELDDLFPDAEFDILFEGDHLHIEYDPK